MADYSVSLSSSKAWEGTIDVTISQSISGNYTDVTAEVWDWKTDGHNSSIGRNFTGTLNVGDESVSFSFDQANTSPTRRAEASVRIYHNSSGAGSVSVSCTIQAPYSSGWGLSGATLSGSRNITLPTIDVKAPTVTCSVSSLKDGGFTLSASANAPCNRWQYQIDGGSWVTFSGDSTSASVEVTGQTAASHTVRVAARKSSNSKIGYSSNVTVDLVKPKITFSVSNITANSFKISITSDVTAKNWYYSIENGTNWQFITATAGTTASVTVTGLAANTTYKVRACAVKNSNGIFGYSSTTDVKTLGGTVLHSVDEISADAETVNLPLRLTVYDAAFYYKVIIKNKSGTSMLEISGYKFSTAGTGLFNVTLTATQRTSLLGKMPNVKSFDGTLYLSTYTDSDCTKQVGDTVSASCTCVTSEANSRPNFTAFTYKDILPGVVAVTGNNQILVQNCSFLQVTCTTYSARNGASITSFSASIADASVSSVSNIMDVGIIDASGQVVLTVKVIDSRGYATTLTQALSFIPYTRPTVNTLVLRRRNEIEDIIQLEIQGSISDIQIGTGVNHNQVNLMGYSYRRSDVANFGDFVSLKEEATITGTTFSFETPELMILDSERSYYFRFQVQDLFGEAAGYDVTILLLKGTPLIAMRKRTPSNPHPCVGINNPDPKSPLDVNGDIRMNGANVHGFVKTLDGTEYLESLEAAGIYLQLSAGAASVNHGYPVAAAGMLEILGLADSFLVQRYITFDGAVYIHVCQPQGSWTDWKQISTSS